MRRIQLCMSVRIMGISPQETSLGCAPFGVQRIPHCVPMRRMGTRIMYMLFCGSPLFTADGCATHRNRPTALTVLLVGYGIRRRKQKKQEEALAFSATAPKNPLTDEEVHFINRDSFQQ